MNSLPLFYEIALPENTGHYPLSAETSKHCIQVLRMQVGESIALTNGRGMKYDAQIITADKKQTVVTLCNKIFTDKPTLTTSIAISFVKNPARMEWFLEKATEIGVQSFFPLITERTAGSNFKADRWESIIISAMEQSQQVWKPQLHQPISFSDLVQQPFNGHKMIAHCEDGVKNSIRAGNKLADQIILIGPEGDFTPEEIKLALLHQFIPISLGITRLRTETAGIAAAVLMQNI